MRVFHILSGKANPNTLNGVNKVVDALAEHQFELGCNVTICGVANNTILRHHPQYGYKLFVRHINPFKYPESLLEYLLGNSDDESIFHFHSAFILWFLPLIKALNKAGRTHLFLTPHGAYIPLNMNSLKKRIVFSLFDSKIIQRVEALHIIGYQTEINEYAKKNAKRIVIIPNGFGNQIIPKSKDEGNGMLVFGYMGRLAIKHKGLDSLIYGFADYKRQGGKGILRLAGGGSDESALKKIIEKECIYNDVQFEGVLYDDEKWHFLQMISAFISPSRWEGMPTACLEAAVSGRPLLVTLDTNMGSYVEKYNAGIVIPSSDRAAITQQLFDFEKIYDDAFAYGKMCKASKTMIDEELNWGIITKRVITELYGREMSY